MGRWDNDGPSRVVENQASEKVSESGEQTQAKNRHKQKNRHRPKNRHRQKTSEKWKRVRNANE